MLAEIDIIGKSKLESESSVSEPQSENTAFLGRACGDDYPDKIFHHNERRAVSARPEPDAHPAPDYDTEGMIPHN